MMGYSPSKKVVSMTTLPDSSSAGSISSSSAASMVCCQVLVEFGMTKPKWKFHSSKSSPLKITDWTSLRLVITSTEEKFSSRDTCLHLRISHGICASISSWSQSHSPLSHMTCPVDASRMFIQLMWNPS
eukprot:CAMPEP_0181459500 /NCGR_PEP_ID=MMETSP1110-20121109/32857_1 /TAXON_ID=174948 /ORGANISM="Symbiodinium sp., Strain CCMP421" /LENGTH=128 /DNA_ID=CAMNT_0023584021 /DNA_START=58 /DNA_END=441 /DNA_ORIENTATION=-